MSANCNTYDEETKLVMPLGRDLQVRIKDIRVF
ncbi:Uncharacterised protein [Neisseria animaloris]|nr:Uncharacterised protein [Neisseria animaloris]